MARRNTLVFIIILALFAFALFVVFPIRGEILAGRGYGWVWICRVAFISSIKADLSAVEAGQRHQSLKGQ